MSSVVQSITGGITGNSGGAGLGYNATQTNIQNDANLNQYNTALDAGNQSVANQQAFLQAVQAQNGLGNQSSVYNQLQGVTNGTGPNPAQAQLAQSTGANIASQNALMAGQRGASSNVGLLARQAAQQGAATQQNAIGQAATLQANQSLNALNSMGSLATSQANQQANATNAYTTAAQGEQGLINNQINAQNSANVGSQGSVNSSNAGISAVAAGQQANLLGNILGGAGAAATMKAEGGMIQKMADGGTATTQLQAPSGAKSKLANYFSNMSTNQNSPQGMQGAAQVGNAIGQGLGTLGKAAYTGIKDYMSSPNTQTVAGGPQDDSAGSSVMAAAEGGKINYDDGGLIGSLAKLAPLLAAAQGGKVPALLSLVSATYPQTR